MSSINMIFLLTPLHGFLVNKVVTSEDETLAVIIIPHRKKTKMITFTEERGFEMFDCNELPLFCNRFSLTRV